MLHPFLKRRDVLFRPRLIVENVKPARFLKFHVQGLIERDAVTPSTKRLAKIGAQGEQVLDRSIVRAHAENHRHCFIDG